MSTTSFSNYLKQKITAVTELGDQVQDNEDEKLEHHFLIYMGSLMGCGGVIWGSVSFYYGLYPASIIPFSYTALTIFNFTTLFT